ncbi:hypothetical protein E8E11_001500 [Didymella keratinophila]|nr:hypothetical protein E8E11_001500 [Didymella keratinophila]
MAATAGPRRVGLSKNASPLLRSIGGKQHAQDKDHEEAQQNTSTLQESHEDVNADPMSSDEEELRKPQPKPPVESLKSRIPSSQNEDGLRKPPGSKRKRKPSLSPEPGLELNIPGAGKRTQKTRNTAPRVSRQGSLQQNQAAKAISEGNKENSRGTQTPPASSGDIWKERFGLLSSQTSQNGSKKTYGGTKTKNLHVAPASTKKQSRKPNFYGTKAKKEHVSSEPEEESDLECEMIDNDELKRLDDELAAIEVDQRQMEELGLRSVPTRTKRSSLPNGHTGEVSAMDDAELDATLGTPTLQEQLGLTGRQEGSLPPSSAPQEEMDNMDDSIREFPVEAEEGTACPICNEPVSQDYYWTFWKGLSKTVKNQAAFCHTHRKATAQQDYLAEGYPSLAGQPHIDWSALSSRIKRHRMALYKILMDKSPSAHRTRYAPLALTGKAAAVPKPRTDLSPSKQEHLESCALDSHGAGPGYYGPRGRRLMTESIMSLLNAEIKKSTDPVVLTSGPATFVQAVLVPEAAVRLIMEDLTCDWERAEEVRDMTGEMGALLNEEVEDRVELGEEGDEEENEYGH